MGRNLNRWRESINRPKEKKREEREKEIERKLFIIYYDAYDMRGVVIIMLSPDSPRATSLVRPDDQSIIPRYNVFHPESRLTPERDTLSKSEIARTEIVSRS